MTAPRNTDQLIRAFLADGQTQLPDRAFDAVRRDIHRTRQRVVIGPWKEPTMSTITRVAIAAAVVVAVGVALINFAPIERFGGNPAQPPTPSPEITTSPTGPLVVPRNAPLPPGDYEFSWSLAAGSDFETGPTITITIPSDGWTSFDQFAADKNYGPGNAGAGPSFVVWKITNRYVDGCSGPSGPPPVLSPAPGPGIDALLEALADQPGIAAGPPTGTTVDGYQGKYIDLRVTADIATCANGFYPWLGKVVQGNNEVLRVYALDVEGFRLTFFLRMPERTTPADRAELLRIVDSVDIQP